MDPIFPFEYGAVYQPIEKERWNYGTEWLRKFSDLQKSSMGHNNYSNSYAYDYPNSHVDSVEWQYYLKPIAFLEKDQKVIAEIMAMETKKFSMLVPAAQNYGINFSQTQISENLKRMFRVEIEANEFIKNFEKVL